MVQPFLIKNNMLFLTQVIDTQLLIRGIENIFTYLYLSLERYYTFGYYLLVLVICVII
jgi:hypothetical protein